MRRKIKLAWIKNETSRKQSFKKRKNGLVKKVQELTTLCGVSAFIVIYGPGEDVPTVWPSPEEACHLMRRFRTVPQMERCKKMVNQESYLRERSTKMKEQLQKLLRKNKERVTSYVMFEIGEGKPLSQFHISELNSVIWLLEEKMKETRRRLEFFRQPHNYYHRDQPAVAPGGGDDDDDDDDDDGGDTASFSLPPPTTEEMTGLREFPWELFYGKPLQGVQPLDLNGYNFLAGGSLSAFSSGGGGGSGSGGGGGESSSALQAYNGDIFGLGYNSNGGNIEVNTNVGFQSYRNNNISTIPVFGEGVNINLNNVSANNVGNEVDLGSYVFFGAGNSTNYVDTSTVGGMSVNDLGLAAPQVNFGGLPINGENNQHQMVIGSALENPNYGHNNIGSGGENLGFGLQPGQGNYAGGNNFINSNMINYNIFHFGAGNDISGHGFLGQTQENYQADNGNNGGNINGYGYAGIGEIGAQISPEMLMFQSNGNGTTNGGNAAAEQSSSGEFGKYWSGFF
ncbi:Agamous-like MADS-box protein AGL36 [Morus notabilis]|uniref:Agamous-like MADS-box protein AGL36 n=1 Tax=Morus notabilis TaxID=981085 RepID=W9RVR1_9ROSA|nr:uncharacterized protein LOC21399937 [Morus notabilis]EXC12981.1 Agamous-like MADS-box protein AGL36 [Morus notabilis]